MFPISEVPLLAGRIGLCALPGRDGDYRGDLAAVLAWRPAMVLTLVSEIELEAAGADALKADLAPGGVDWRHLPVCNFRAPAAAGSAAWADVSGTARAVLSGGGGVLVHCYGGSGRAGMAALRLMVDSGEAPEPALARLRAVRPCAVESVAQFVWAGGAAPDFPGLRRAPLEPGRLVGVA